jgi:hypothetical protein
MSTSKMRKDPSIFALVLGNVHVKDEEGDLKVITFGK